MDAFNWLHLTDLHWGLTGQKHLWLAIRDEFFRDLARLCTHTGPWHAVLFTGDFVQNGAKEEFETLEEHVLGPLWQQFADLGCNPVLLAVPGNHDLQRPDGKSFEAAADTLKTPGGFRNPNVVEKFWEKETSQYRRLIKRVFSNYAAWRATRPHCTPAQTVNEGLLPGDFSTTYVTAGGHKIGIVGLNTAFLQLGDEIQQGHLACDQRQFHRVCDGDGAKWCRQHDICLLMTHQPPVWLDQRSREHAYPDINKPGQFAAHLFGHMHEQMLCTYSRAGGAQVGWVQACSLFGMEHYGDAQREDRRHGYSAGTLRFVDETAQLRHWPRRARHDAVNGWWFDRDPDCTLDDDGGTNAKIISLRPDQRGTVGATSEPIEQLTARALGNYHLAAQREWDERWSGVVGEETTELPSRSA